MLVGEKCLQQDQVTMQPWFLFFMFKRKKTHITNVQVGEMGAGPMLLFSPFFCFIAWKNSRFGTSFTSNV